MADYRTVPALPNRNAAQPSSARYHFFVDTSSIPDSPGPLHIPQPPSPLTNIHTGFEQLPRVGVGHTSLFRHIPDMETILMADYPLARGGTGG